MVIGSLLVLSLVTLSVSEIPQHRITNLPGLTTQPSFGMYSGYITVNGATGRRLFYFVVESQTNPQTDPVVLYLNGGPGCSSLVGLFYENGPFKIRTNMTLVPNPDSWNKAATVIYLDSPCGTGYSYSTTQGDYHSTDKSTADDEYQFLVQFFLSYPELNNNQPLFLAGEGYAGHYIPMLALRIHNGNIGTNFINLQGFMIGNPVTDERIDSDTFFRYMYSHVLISKDAYEQVQTYCVGMTPTNSSKECQAKVLLATKQAGTVNPYNILANCSNTSKQQQQRQQQHQEQDTILHRQWFERTNIVDTFPCVDMSTITRYLNQGLVKASLHTLSNLVWTPCSTTVQYTPGQTSVLNVYRLLLPKYRVLIYSGELDMTVNALGTQLWTQLIGGGSRAVQTWQPWSNTTNPTNGVGVDGFVKKFPNNITFLTFVNTGHFVATERPSAAYHVLESFLNNKPF